MRRIAKEMNKQIKAATGADKKRKKGKKGKKGGKSPEAATPGVVTATPEAAHVQPGPDAAINRCVDCMVLQLCTHTHTHEVVGKRALTHHLHTVCQFEASCQQAVWIGRAPLPALLHAAAELTQQDD